MEFLEQYGLSEDMAGKVIDYGVKAAGALAVLFVGWIIAGFVSRMVIKGLAKAKFDVTLSRFAARLAKWTVLLLVVLACLSMFGIETTSFAAVIAAASLAIGMSLQGTLGNFAAGVMLLIFRPYKIGDLIKVEGQTGIIHEIGIFTTEMNTLGNRRVIIPNGKAFGGIIENVSYNKHIRADIDVGVEYTADIDKTRAVLEKAAKSVKRTETEPFQIFLSGLGDSSVNWQVRVPASPIEYWDVYQATIRAVKMELDQAGIGIPFPQRDVHLFNKN